MEQILTDDQIALPRSAEARGLMVDRGETPIGGRSLIFIRCVPSQDQAPPFGGRGAEIISRYDHLLLRNPMVK